MTLEELAAATGLTANDLLGIWDTEASGSTEPTQKITAQQLAAAVKVLANLQGALTFDSTPTTGSTNPVTSGGVATAIQQSTANMNVISAATAIPSQSVANGAFTTMATFTPSESGSYMIVVDMEYGTATQGNRILLVDTTETSSNNASNSVLAQGRAILEKTRVFTLTTSNTVYIRAYQNSGSALSCSGTYRVLRLK